MSELYSCSYSKDKKPVLMVSCRAFLGEVDSNTGERSLGVDREPQSTLLQLTVLNTQSIRKVEADNQPFEPQQLCHSHKIQDGDSIFALKSH